MPVETMEREIARGTLTVPGGATAAVGTDGDTLDVRSPEGRLLFQYESRTGACRVYAPTGDLELHSGGAIRLVAADGIRLEGREVTAAAAIGVSLRTGLPGATESSALRMTHGHLGMTAPSLRVDAAAAQVAIGRARYRGDEVRLTAKSGHFDFTTLETTAKRIWQKGKELVQRIEGLCDQRAGRLRTLVDGSMELKGDTVFLKGKDAVRIDGKRIDLG